jgi:hypothetical protein
MPLNLTPMNARTFAAYSIALMTLGRMADTLVTYSFTPTLDLEANPLVSVLGLGWSPLLAVNLVVIVALGSCSIFWCKRPSRYERSPEVHDLWTFASFACYGRVYPPLKFLGRRLLVPPTQRAHNLHLIGAVMPITVAVVSAAAVFSWQAIYGHQWEGYSLLYTRLFPFFPYAIVIPTVWLAGLVFYRYEFRRYQEQYATEMAPAEIKPQAERISEHAVIMEPSFSMQLGA